MKNPFISQDSGSFSWESIGKIEDGRKNLGSQMPVLVYRLFQYTMREALEKKYGKKETIDIFRTAGEIAGSEFAKNVLQLDLPANDFFAQLQQVIMENKIGVLRIEQFNQDSGHAVLTVGEDLDCSGLPVTGETVCNYDEGFLAGILKMYTKRDYVVTEIDCWSTGARVCRFEAKVKSGT